MANMIVSAPVVKQVVDDYDFTFLSGMTLPITVNRAAGDTIDFGSEFVNIFLSAKPSLNDPEKLLPAETIRIFTKHLAVQQQRSREVTVLSPEEQFEWKKTLHKLSEKVQ